MVDASALRPRADEAVTALAIDRRAHDHRAGVVRRDLAPWIVLGGVEIAAELRGAQPFRDVDPCLGPHSIPASPSLSSVVNPLSAGPAGRAGKSSRDPEGPLGRLEAAPDDAPEQRTRSDLVRVAEGLDSVGDLLVEVDRLLRWIVRRGPSNAHGGCGGRTQHSRGLPRCVNCRHAPRACPYPGDPGVYVRIEIIRWLPWKGPAMHRS